MKQHLKIIAISTVITIFIIIILFSQVIFTSPLKSPTPICLNYDIVGSSILIDDSDPLYSWSTTRDTYPWCTGEGTPSNPFVIQDVNIDAQGNSECILISNSDSYFMIINCELKNAGGGTGMGLKLYNVKNGVAYNNFIYDNEWKGIDCYESENMIIEDNSIGRHTVGMDITNCENIELSDNIVFQDDLYLISMIGIYVCNTNDSIIHQNIISGSHDGLYLMHSSYNDIKYNLVSESDEYGILAIYQSNFNSITDNTLPNNVYCIGIGESCVGNEVARNGDCQLYIVHDVSDPPPDDPSPGDNPPDNFTIPGLNFFGLWMILLVGITIAIVIRHKKLKFQFKNF